MGSGEEGPEAQPALRFLPVASKPRRLAAIGYSCSLCGEQAGGIEFWYADSGNAEVIIRGLVGEAHVPLTADSARELASMVGEGVEALYAYDQEWASFYCPPCDRIYCQKHWQLEIEIENDPLPSWYDCTHGTCPKGHRRIVDD